MNLIERKNPAGQAEHSPEAAGGGAEALAADLLFRRHHKEVLRVVRRLLGPNANQQDIEDVAQQVFISVYRSLPKFRGESATSTWLYRIIVNAVLMHLRSWKRRKRALEAFLESWLTTRTPCAGAVSSSPRSTCISAPRITPAPPFTSKKRYSAQRGSK